MNPEETITNPPSPIETPPATPPVPTPTETTAPPSTPAPEPVPPAAPAEPISQPTAAPATPPPPAVESPIRSLLNKALAKIQFRKQAKLEKIMVLAKSKGQITNDDAQKLLRVSDATASRYLAELVKNGRLRRTGVRGGTVYHFVQ